MRGKSMSNNCKGSRDSIFTIMDIEPRQYAPGDWVTGWIYGFRFCALVFFGHANNPSWEIARSRISKLELRDQYKDRIVYSWDRGEDLPATEYGSKAAVEFLAIHLADLVYATDGKRKMVQGVPAGRSTYRSMGSPDFEGSWSD